MIGMLGITLHLELLKRDTDFVAKLRCVKP